MTKRALSASNKHPAAAPQPAVRPTESQALIAAYEAALAVASELGLETVLQRIVDLAREVVPARYAALGVADVSGRIQQFITSGMTTEERAAIGPLPRGHGLLGELIRKGEPLLVPDMAADPRSVGFPPNHPPMRSLLGVPILLGERTLGNLYLTERGDGAPFTQEDLQALRVLAAHAATAIDRAHLYQQVEMGRRRAEERRDHLHVILDQLPAGVWIHAAPDGQIESANAAAVELLLGPAALPGVLPAYGRSFQFFEADGTPISHDERPGIRALCGDVVRNRQLELRRADGQHIPVLVQAAPLRDTTGVVTHAVVVVQDVTRLHEAEQLKDDFLALVSHEFRTPLTAIHGGAYLLAQQGNDLDAGTCKELLEDIVTESARLDTMLRNMMNLAAVMAGRLHPSAEPVLLDRLVRAAVAQIAPRAPAHRFLIEMPAELPMAEGDPALMEEVLLNLYENAIKYSPAGGVVRTTAEADADFVTVHVTDQGLGIAPEHVGHVFERFRRPGADPTTRGMGLGLYLSQRLVEAQCGRIAVDSPGPGKGSTFSVTLPIARGVIEAIAIRVPTAPKR